MPSGRVRQSGVALEVVVGGAEELLDRGGATEIMPDGQFIRQPHAAMEMHRILADGSYRKHVDRLRERVDKARHRCLRQLEALGCHAVHEPVAGTFAWVDCGMDSELLARYAAEHELLLAPGVLFSPRQAPSTLLRISVAMAEQPTAWQTLELLLKRHRTA